MTRQTFRLFASLALLGAIGVPAFGQAIGNAGSRGEEVKKEALLPPIIQPREDGGQTTATICCFLLIALCLGAPLLPSRRGHQD